MKKILFCVLCLTLLFGCGQSKKFIPEKTLVSIVKDIYISNSYANNFQPDLLCDTVNYYEPILKKYLRTVVPSDAALCQSEVLAQFPRSYGRKLQPIRPFLCKNTKKTRFFAFFPQKICVYAIFVVPLHPLSVESDVL